jgi:nanoRNase/pAp phosphatase (c-di-AMP/oligoRNAs hydrolase)
MKLSEAVSIYIQLRDQKAQLKAAFDEKVAPLQEKMDKLEAKLLEVFNQTGMDSVKTEFGTAYSTVRTTASVADRDSFMDFVKANEEWALLEVRVSKSAVEQFRSANDNELPPGINIREERVVNVRRSA